MNKKFSIKKMFKVTPKNITKPIFKTIYVNNGFMYATDSFKIIKMKAPEEYSENTGFITPASLLQNEIILKEAKSKKQNIPELVQINEDYPDAEKIFSMDNYTDIFTVNRQYLIDTLEALQANDHMDSVNISFSEDKRKIKLENDNGSGIIMLIENK